MDKLIKKARFAVDGVPMVIQLRRYDNGDFAMSGECDGSLGQCVGEIRRLAGDVGAVEELLTLWDTHHLKKAPDEAFTKAAELLEFLDGRRIGDAPDVSDAPEIGGDVFDSRDVIRRFEIYRAAVVDLGIEEDDVDTFDNGENWPDSMEGRDLDGDQQEIIDEFLRLRDFCEAGENVGGDWSHGETIVADSYFEEYAEEFAGDVGLINSDARWPNNCIDWAKAAAQLQQDFTEVEYDGRTYWIRG